MHIFFLAVKALKSGSRSRKITIVRSQLACVSSMHTAQRAPVLLGLQQTHSNRYVQRVVAVIPAKLKVGQPGDIYEQEADLVADAVMRMPNPKVQRQANVTKEKLPIHAKTITPIRTLKVQRQKVEGFGYDFGQVRILHDETETETETAHALKEQIEDER